VHRTALAALLLTGCFVELRDATGAPCDARGCPAGLSCRGFVCVPARPTPACSTPPGLDVVWSQCAEGFADGGTGPLIREAVGPATLPAAVAAMEPLPLRAMMLSGRVTVAGEPGTVPMALMRVVSGQVALIEVSVQRRGDGVAYRHDSQQGLFGMGETTTWVPDPPSPLERPVRLALRFEPGRLVQLDVDGRIVSQTVGGEGGRDGGTLRLEWGPFQVPSGADASVRFEGFEAAWPVPQP
jgi:hypothetical protein